MHNIGPEKRLASKYYLRQRAEKAHLCSTVLTVFYGFVPADYSKQLRCKAELHFDTETFMNCFMYFFDPDLRFSPADIGLETLS